MTTAPFPTIEQDARFSKDMRDIAKEDVSVKMLCGTYYVYGSELACLRIFYKYNRNDRAENTLFGYSENRQCHYFALEPK